MRTKKHNTNLFNVTILCALMFSMSGCSAIKNMISLSNDLQEIQETIDVVSGVVINKINDKGQINAKTIVALISSEKTPEPYQVLAYKILGEESNHFVFTQVKSDSMLVAFHDLNGNYILDSDEPSVVMSSLPKTSEHTLDRNLLTENKLFLSDKKQQLIPVDVSYEAVKSSVSYM